MKQYRYNPAIVISGAVGTPVTAAADGKVTDVSVHAETGTTVTVDLGGGYTAIYGQLKEAAGERGQRAVCRRSGGVRQRAHEILLYGGKQSLFCAAERRSADGSGGILAITVHAQK